MFAVSLKNFQKSRKGVESTNLPSSGKVTVAEICVRPQKKTRGFFKVICKVICICLLCGSPSFVRLELKGEEVFLLFLHVCTIVCGMFDPFTD